MSGRPDTTHALCETCERPIINDQYDVQTWERKGLILCPLSDIHACIERGSRLVLARAARQTRRAA